MKNTPTQTDTTLEESLEGILRMKEPLKDHTSWHIGGPADQYFRPRTGESLSHFLKSLSKDEPITFLGLGSNVLISDQGVKGTLIHTLGMDQEKDGIQIISDELNHQRQGSNQGSKDTLDTFLVRASAGVTCAKLAKFSAKQGLLGGEFFAGIPGTIGGALTMNAGAFGGETWANLVSVEVINRQGDILQRSLSDYEVGYRSVRPLKPDSQLGFISGLFQFKKGDAETAAQNIKQLLKKRSATQPIGSFNCGSVFKNPPNDYAARLIEAAGLKGKQIGRAQISERHANFIINLGEASAEEVLSLIHLIIQTVYVKDGVLLIPEVRFLGWDPKVLQQALAP